ncbi:MAG: aminopeptidase P family protein [Candidatus Cloacimonetes bacterium]|nr:aminopeptidase P family protein [Candidatus Cloacimonadota bacterium]
MNIPQRVSALRELMMQNGIDVWIITGTDPHLSEYQAERWSSRGWISGFTGSAGVVVITANRAGLWTDFRYFIQATAQLEGSGIQLFKTGMPDVPDYREWLATVVDENATIGFDGHCMSLENYRTLSKKLSGKQFIFETDLLNNIWENRPAVPLNSVFIHEEAYAGESRQSKIARLRSEMAEMLVESTVIAMLDDIAWLFNLRGSDMKYTPLFIAYALVTQSRVSLYIDSAKVPEDVAIALQADGIELKNYKTLLEDLATTTGKITFDPKKVSVLLKSAIPDNCDKLEKSGLVEKLKAIKNDTQIEGFRQSHIRDGVAMVRWARWLKTSLGSLSLNEWNVAEKLTEFRAEEDLFHSLSFNTICGYGANGAIVHYSADKENPAEIQADNLLLIDSGGQYFDGTTDVTRTLALGKPTEQQVYDYTMVLKAHLALAMCRFPEKTNGAVLAGITQAVMWQAGLNYGHGTGHGVGHFLGVHEGPQIINPRSAETNFESSMVVSNEPGIYREGKYGIRIENLIVVRKPETTEFGEFLSFETLTMCPYESVLIDTNLLNNVEIEWINAYHREVFEKVSPLLEEADKNWLAEATRPIKRFKI